MGYRKADIEETRVVGAGQNKEASFHGFRIWLTCQ